MKKLLAVFVVLSLVYSFVPVSVNGSLYVVTNSATVVPMPMTDIEVYPLKEFQIALFDKQSYYREHCVDLPDKIQVELDYLQHGPHHNNAKANYELILTCEPAALLSSLDVSAIKTVQTNKDGAFSFARSRYDKLVLVAHAKRDLALVEESYQWIKVIDSSLGFSQSVEINNTDLVTDTDVRNIQL